MDNKLSHKETKTINFDTDNICLHMTLNIFCSQNLRDLQDIIIQVKHNEYTNLKIHFIDERFKKCHQRYNIGMHNQSRSQIIVKHI